VSNVPTPQERDAFALFHAFMRGWTTGAKAGAPDPALSNNTNRSVRDEYLLGLTKGRKARLDVSKETMRRTGYVPNPLRVEQQEST
jgi:hypothetical protein